MREPLTYSYSVRGQWEFNLIMKDTFTRAAGHHSSQLELTPQWKCLMMTNGFFLISIIMITLTITPPFIINIKAVIAWVDSHIMLVFTCQFLFRKSPMSVTTVNISEVVGRPVETCTAVIFLQSLLNSVRNRLQLLTVARRVLPYCKNTVLMWLWGAKWEML